MPAAEEKKTFFKVLQNFKADYAPAEFTLYESERTGMRVVVCDRKGPKVYGYFSLATEIHDDSGAPHTLEHLCFMGSESYKYKGVLDKLANRAYSNTNAWTAVDNTTYTLDSAGWEGFAQILPVYLEHVLLPTLTDAGCYTEVHHVDGAGNDAGVVYSEMQGVQNNQGELMELQARRLLYPEGDGFRYETGGMMEQLRVLTADRIREFHKEMYQPKNLCLVLVGEVDHGNMLDILDEFESGIYRKMPPKDAPFKRPWVDSKRTPPLSQTIVDRVEFPEEDESFGEILIGFFGPDCNESPLETAVNVLLTYLAESSVSVLVNTLVEKEQLASGIYYSVDIRPSLLIWFTLSSVATEKLADVERRFFDVLRKTAEEPLDMAYMRECLNRTRRQTKFATESSSGIFSDCVIYDHLFGKRDGTQLVEALESLNDFDQLEGWSEKQWNEFLKKWLSDAHHVSILGVPSAELSKKLKKDEKARVKAQQERLGEEGLKKLAEKLEEAKAENDKPIPDEMLDKFKTPGTESIHFFPTVTARSGLAKQKVPLDNEIQKIIDKDEAGTPLFIHFEHIPSNFVHLSVILSTSSVPLELKPLLAVYMENFFNTPILRDGKRIEFEQVVTELESDTVVYTIDNGGPIGNSELIQIKFVVEPEKYQTAIKWLREMMFSSIFDEERLGTTLTRMLADVPESKRSGNGMAYAIDSIIHFAPSSSTRAQNTLVKALYLKRTLHLLSKSPEEVIGRFETVRKQLLTFSNMRALVIANLERLSKPVSSWSHLTSGLDVGLPLNPLDSRKDILSDAAKKPGSLAYIAPLPPVDSSYLLLTARGPDSYDHPKLPALMVAIAYLEAVEGPLWVAVRGTGLAYGSSFSRGTDTGLICYRVYRSPNAYEAYRISREVVQDFIAGKRPFEKLALEGAISSIVVGFADEQATMSATATLSFVNQVVRGIEKDWSDKMLKKVREIGEKEIKEVLQEIVLPVFLPEKADLVVTCATIMQDDLKKNFEAAGFKPQVQPLAYFQDDYGLKPEEGEDDDDDLEDEEMDGDEIDEDEESDEGEE